MAWSFRRVNEIPQTANPISAAYLFDVIHRTVRRPARLELQAVRRTFPHFRPKTKRSRGDTDVRHVPRMGPEPPARQVRRPECGPGGTGHARQRRRTPGRQLVPRALSNAPTPGPRVCA